MPIQLTKSEPAVQGVVFGYFEKDESGVRISQSRPSVVELTVYSQLPSLELVPPVATTDEDVDEDIDEDGRSALYRASSSGDISVVENLVRNGILSPWY